MTGNGTEVTVLALPECDIHKYERRQDGVLAAYDGKTTRGPWANMCEACFAVHGVGLGTGRGQRLILKGAAPDNAPDPDEKVLAHWRNGKPAVMTFLGGLCLLTQCCGADGKGTANNDTGVCCRSCYREVSSEYGGVFPADQLDRIVTIYGLVKA